MFSVCFLKYPRAASSVVSEFMTSLGPSDAVAASGPLARECQPGNEAIASCPSPWGQCGAPREAQTYFLKWNTPKIKSRAWHHGAAEVGRNLWRRRPASQLQAGPAKAQPGPAGFWGSPGVPVERVWLMVSFVKVHGRGSALTTSSAAVLFLCHSFMEYLLAAGSGLNMILLRLSLFFKAEGIRSFRKTTALFVARGAKKA